MRQNKCHFDKIYTVQQLGQKLNTYDISAQFSTVTSIFKFFSFLNQPYAQVSYMFLPWLNTKIPHIYLLYLFLCSTRISFKFHVFIFCAVSFLKLIQMLQLGKLLAIVQILVLLCLNRYITSFSLIPKMKIDIKFTNMRNECISFHCRH